MLPCPVLESGSGYLVHYVLQKTPSLKKLAEDLKQLVLHHLLAVNTNEAVGLCENIN